MNYERSSVHFPGRAFRDDAVIARGAHLVGVIAVFSPIRRSNEKKQET